MPNKPDRSAAGKAAAGRVAIRQGGYETRMRKWADNAEEIVVAQSLKLLRKVAAKRS